MMGLACFAAAVGAVIAYRRGYFLARGGQGYNILPVLHMTKDI